MRSKDTFVCASPCSASSMETVGYAWCTRTAVSSVLPPMTERTLFVHRPCCRNDRLMSSVLVKWANFPHSDCTWETPQDVKNHLARVTHVSRRSGNNNNKNSSRKSQKSTGAAAPFLRVEGHRQFHALIAAYHARCADHGWILQPRLNQCVRASLRVYIVFAHTSSLCRFGRRPHV